MDPREKHGLRFIKAQSALLVSTKVIISIICLNLIGSKYFDHFFLVKFLTTSFCINLYDNDFELFRILAILRGLFHNLWIMAYSACKIIVSLVKPQALIFLEYCVYEGVI